jgi:hypothetical protein
MIRPIEVGVKLADSIVGPGMVEAIAEGNVGHTNVRVLLDEVGGDYCASSFRQSGNVGNVNRFDKVEDIVHIVCDKTFSKDLDRGVNGMERSKLFRIVQLDGKGRELLAVGKFTDGEGEDVGLVESRCVVLSCGSRFVLR